MYTLAASAFPTLPTTPQASVASMIASPEPVVGRLPAAEVSRGTPDTEVRNDAANNPPYVSTPDQAGATDNTVPSFSSAPSSDTAISAFPSLFLAQLMGQNENDPQTQSIVNSYAQVANSGVTMQQSIAQNTSGANPALAFAQALQNVQATNSNTPPQASNTNIAYVPQAQAAVSASAPPPVSLPQNAGPVVERRFSGGVRAVSNASSQTRGNKAYGATLALTETSSEESLASL